MDEFVSEPIVPHAGTFSTAPMAAGLPGLPGGFDWRGVSVLVADVLGSWKQSGPEIGRLSGERYLRRHYFRLRMADGGIWVVYFLRHTPQSGSPRRRWFLERVEGEQAGQTPPHLEACDPPPPPPRHSASPGPPERAGGGKGPSCRSGGCNEAGFQLD